MRRSCSFDSYEIRMPRLRGLIIISFHSWPFLSFSFSSCFGSELELSLRRFRATGAGGVTGRSRSVVGEMSMQRVFLVPWNLQEKAGLVFHYNCWHILQ